MKLTIENIDRLKYTKTDNKQQVIWDNALPGFGVRVYPSGKKSFVLSYRIRGRKRIMVLGLYGVLTLDEARKRARKKLVEALDGVDPLDTRREASREATVSKLCEDFLERHSKQHKKSWKKDESRIRRYVVPKLGNFKVSAVTTDNIASLHHNISKHAPYEANRVLDLIGIIFSKGALWGFPVKKNPREGITKNRELKRDRWISPAEMPKLAEAIDGETNYYAKQAIWLYLLTGLRKNELLLARWEDYDEERQDLRIPSTKNQSTHYIPISEPAAALLDELPRVAGNPFILPGQKEGQHLVNIDKPWRRIRREAGVEDVRLHDLRRTVGSWLAQSGNSLHLIGRVLNHTNPRTTQVYARFAQDNVRRALEDHGKKIQAFTGKSPKMELVESKAVANG